MIEEVRQAWAVVVEHFGSQAEAGRRVGISRSLVTHYRQHDLPPRASWCIRWEIQTKGKLTARELRPDLWRGNG